MPTLDELYTQQPDPLASMGQKYRDALAEMWRKRNAAGVGEDNSLTYGGTVPATAGANARVMMNTAPSRPLTEDYPFLPRYEDFRQSLYDTNRAAAEMTQSGATGMQSGDPLKIGLGAMQSAVAPLLPAIAPVGAAFSALGKAAGRVGPGLEHAFDVASWFNPETMTGNLGKLAPAIAAVPPIARRAAKVAEEAKPADWFGQSKVVDAEGKPLTVYRGEHGEPVEGQPFQSKLNSLSFGDKDAANLYAMDPNDSRMTVQAPRVTPGQLKIEKPIIDNRSDPFIDLAHLEKELGTKEATRIAKRFDSDIRYTNNWEENYAGKYDSVADLLKESPSELKNLYFDTHKYLDDPKEVELLKKKGYDGAIHIGNGETATNLEYRIFDPKNFRSQFAETMPVIPKESTPLEKLSPGIGHNNPPPEMALSRLGEVQNARSAIQQEYGAIGTHPDEQALTINNILDEMYAGPVKPRARNVSDIGGDLHAAGSEALRNLGVEEGKIDFKTATPHQDEIVSRAVASEIMAALKRGGKTARDWYTKAVEEAMAHAEAIHPELANDPLQKMGFTAALSITSQGEKVRSNVRLAEQAYDTFKKTGRFPTDINAKAGAAMNDNFTKLNNLIDTIGPEATIKFLHNEYTVKELQQLGHDVGGENMGAKVYGSSILGPKIGQGFFQNLNGNYNPVTMDLWFMRAMGRLTGTLAGKVDISKQTQRFTKALEKEGLPVPATAEEMSRLADDIVLQHERDFRTNRAAYDSGDKTRSELSYAAERLQAGLSGLNETPTGGGHRQWLRDRVQRAKELLKEHGHDLTAADMQAIWWYPEKDLYGKLGGLPSEGINTDYAAAYRELRDKHGKP